MKNCLFPTRISCMRHDLGGNIPVFLRTATCRIDRYRVIVASSLPPEAPSAPSSASSATCRRCKQTYNPEDNGPRSCRYHPEMWTGGEVSKYVGFVRASEAPEDQLLSVWGRRGLWRFYDCCGAEEEAAPGCSYGRHVQFGEPDP